ncbi:hypothetical protein FUAX_43850 (plasmid) [Fulvitalea axinellae]|uniref:DUF2147 domain-containing protein n=1 Tax=Fulvitalea axinellae TaxID=1182444 RepID=A0AAU9CNS6_9BACT|nr:hypothetical protein FUAX_43850 [Fulvitalea axinellae]
MVKFYLIPILITTIFFINNIEKQLPQETIPQNQLIGKWQGPNGVVWSVRKEKEGYIALLADFGVHSGIPERDIHNSDPELRSRQCLNIFLATDIRKIGKLRWKSDSLYDPATGLDIHARLELIGDDQLKVTRYVFIPFFGESTYWTRLRE